MKILDRIWMAIMALVNKLLNRIDDPCANLDVAYEKQLEMQINVKKSIAEVMTSQKQMELTRSRIVDKIEEEGNQAKACLRVNNETGAKQHVETKLALQAQVGLIDKEIRCIKDNIDKLLAVDSKMTQKITILKLEKERIKAEYNASKAQVKLSESCTGLSDDLIDIGKVVQDANDKMDTMKAKTSAIAELVDKGVLTDAIQGPGMDEVTNEDVETEMKNLRTSV